LLRYYFSLPQNVSFHISPDYVNLPRRQKRARYTNPCRRPYIGRLRGAKTKAQKRAKSLTPSLGTHRRAVPKKHAASIIHVFRQRGI
jgi:hypothetical protein